MLPLLHEINAKEPWAVALEDEQFPEITSGFRTRVKQGERLDALLPEAFALVREAARRRLGERLYDVQILGGLALHQGKIMEMKTGEGKTVSCVTAAYLNALTGRSVHVVTVNDYLAGRDADWMRPVYELLGMTVGAVVSQMDNEARKGVYRCDVTYGTNNEFGFDYLRDNMRFDAAKKVQTGHSFCIIDEIDSILIDEARTPLIISGAAEDDTQKFAAVNKIVRDLNECEKDQETGEYPEEPVGDYKLEEKGKRVSFTDQGLNHLEEILVTKHIISGSLFVDENFEYIHYATQALKSHYLFHRDTDYVVKEGTVQIVDEFTGRILHGRRYSDGLHQAIEAKEGVRIAQRNRTLATVTFQNFFRMYDKVSGMTGTAATEAKEFGKIYGLEVVVIPTNRPVVRKDQDDVIYLDEADKYGAICDEIERVHKKGQPMLVGTASIERSEHLDHLLSKRGIPHEVLNAKNHAREALIVAEAGAKGSVTIATNMAGRGTDIKLGGNPEFRARRRAGSESDEAAFEEAYRIERQTWRPQYDEVRSLGGLYILGTERHESRRIDNQLRGRSGRQGDPGESKFYLSMDDDLMRLFGGGRANLKSLMQRVGMVQGEPLNSPLINKSIERAQSKVEERNFEIRKHLLEFDDVLNEQRKFIYGRRDEILADKNLKERILVTAAEVVEEAIADAGEDGPTGVAMILQDRLFFSPQFGSDVSRDTPGSVIKKIVLSQMRQDLDEKEAQAGTEQFNLILRIEYLRNIDNKWQDHLESLESLREAVYLRSYAQKNPLLEYKLEGFQIFDDLLDTIRVAIARKIFAVKADGFRVVERRRSPAAGGQEQHRSMSAFGAAAAGSGHAPGGSPGGSGTGTAAATLPKQAQIRRTVPKVGRNDPCPCGSGKKYKYCHGQ